MLPEFLVLTLQRIENSEQVNYVLLRWLGVFLKALTNLLESIAHTRSRSDSDIGRAARLTLARSVEIHLDFELTTGERREAEALYPMERFDHSIGEPLAAADQLTARFNAGRADDPAGYALVQATIDWRRAGLSRPIRDSELRELYANRMISARMVSRGPANRSLHTWCSLRK